MHPSIDQPIERRSVVVAYLLETFRSCIVHPARGQISVFTKVVYFAILFIGHNSRSGHSLKRFETMLESDLRNNIALVVHILRVMPRPDKKNFVFLYIF